MRKKLIDRNVDRAFLLSDKQVVKFYIMVVVFCGIIGGIIIRLTFIEG